MSKNLKKSEVADRPRHADIITLAVAAVRATLPKSGAKCTGRWGHNTVLMVMSLVRDKPAQTTMHTLFILFWFTEIKDILQRIKEEVIFRINP